MRQNHVNLDSPQEAGMLDIIRAHKNLEDKESVCQFNIEIPCRLKDKLKLYAALHGKKLKEVVTDIFTNEIEKFLAK